MSSNQKNEKQGASDLPENNLCGAKTLGKRPSTG